MTGYTTALDDISADDLLRVGGKALGLAALVAGGFPVPPAFAITTDAYVRFLEESGLQPRIAKIVGAADFSQPGDLEEACDEIRGLITNSRLPEDVAAAVREGYTRLGPDIRVAVRSSATSEDLADASFAGQHDTYLDLVGADAVLDGVLRCWASLWTSRAASYRAAKGFDGLEHRAGVVVQVMVEAEAAGVLFTVHPLSGDETHVVINANWGLGESVVSGVANPDEWVIDKQYGATIECRVGGKEVRIVRDALGQGTIEERPTAEERAAWCLDDSVVSQLCELGRSIEQKRGGVPQDVEWALCDGQIFLLQSRDITAIDVPFHSDMDKWQDGLVRSKDVVWSRRFADEYWTGPCSPLYYSIRGATSIQGMISMHETFHTKTREQMSAPFRWHLGRVFVNSPEWRDMTIYYVPPQARESNLRALPPELRNGPGTLAYLKHFGSGYRNLRRVRPDLSWRRWMQTNYELYESSGAEVALLKEVNLSALHDVGLREHLESVIELEVQHMRAVTLAFTAYMPLVLMAFGGVLFKWADDTDQMLFGSLLAALDPAVPTTEENLEAWDLAQQLKEVPQIDELLETTSTGALVTTLRAQGLGAEFLANYDRFVAEHGHRGHSDRDIAFPRWGDDPSVLEGTLRTLLNAGPTVDAHAMERSSRAKRETATAQVRDRLRGQRVGGLRLRLFDFLLSQAHQALRLRDVERYEVDKLTWEMRRVTQEYGRRLVERDLLDDPKDVEMLSKEEVFELCNQSSRTPLLGRKITSRRRLMGRHREAPVFLKGNSSYSVEEVSADAGDALVGVATSAGVCTGTARVITELADMPRLRAGDVLITNSTDPGWTSAFLLIQGLVLETGGMLAHGSVLSREYGLPAVTAVENATQRIPDGATVTVNGNSGTVTVHEPANSADGNP